MYEGCEREHTPRIPEASSLLLPLAKKYTLFDTFSLFFPKTLAYVKKKQYLCSDFAGMGSGSPDLRNRNKQEMDKKRTLVTAALPYANGPVHIGHLAGVYVPADIYVRYLRLRGEDVLFIGGSDEHGVPVTIRARKEGITVQDVVDRYHYLIKDSFERFGISFDIYSRTTSKIHHQMASDFFRTLYDNDKLIVQTSEQFYDEETKEFLTDRNIRGECPRCHSAGA